MALTVQVLVTGRVQGVGYRAWTESEARRRGLDGWVRNRRDGSVEAVFSGSDAAVRQMLGALRQGPAAARVADVAESESHDPVGRGFEVLPTA